MTATPTQANPNDPDIAQEMEKKTGQKSKYVIFIRITDEFGEKDVWEELGEVEADGAYAAREQAIKEFSLMQEVRDGTLEIVSLGKRFWLPKKPKVQVSESLDVS